MKPRVLKGKNVYKPERTSNRANTQDQKATRKQPSYKPVYKARHRTPDKPKSRGQKLIGSVNQRRIEAKDERQHYKGIRKKTYRDQKIKKRTDKAIRKGTARAERRVNPTKGAGKAAFRGTKKIFRMAKSKQRRRQRSNVRIKRYRYKRGK